MMGKETPAERQAWIEKAERDFPIDFEKVWSMMTEIERLRDINAELLEACKVAEKILIAETDWRFYASEIEQLRAAIAKATGGGDE
jgi:DNA polymerase III alpha subunit (gram-positive type)